MNMLSINFNYMPFKATFAGMKIFKLLLVVSFLTACNSVGSGFISAVDLKDKISSSRIQLVDLRSQAEFDSGHIEGAYHYDFSVLGIDEFKNQFYKDLPLYLYSGADSQALKFVAQLKTLGYENVTVLDGGVEAWKKSGFTLKEKIIFPSDTIEFDSAILGNKLVMADFNAEWCGPCKLLEPLVLKIREEMRYDVIVYSIDTDKKPEIANRYVDNSIPLLVFFKNGEIVHKILGYSHSKTDAEIYQTIEKYK